MMVVTTMRLIISGTHSTRGCNGRSQSDDTIATDALGRLIITSISTLSPIFDIRRNDFSVFTPTDVAVAIRPQLSRVPILFWVYYW